MNIFIVYFCYDIDKIFTTEEAARRYMEKEREEKAGYAREDCWYLGCYEVESEDGE